MLRSMTGFGAAEAEDEGRIVSVEARSVNHRYLDVRIHLPSDLMRLVAPLEARVRKQLSRGRVDVAVKIETKRGVDQRVEVDADRARAYQEAYASLAGALGLEGEASLVTIASSPGVMTLPDVVSGIEEEHVAPALDAALEKLAKMRETEGAALQAELLGHLDEVNALVVKMRELVPEVTAERRAKLEERVAKLLDDVKLDPVRIAQETAILADRADVTEEVERLESHSAQFASQLAGKKGKGADAIGRRLDFLIQEMNREANTIGSKCANASAAYVVVDLKSELERMREQVQNVE